MQRFPLKTKDFAAVETEIPTNLEKHDMALIANFIS
jgi:hypothetical protein